MAAYISRHKKSHRLLGIRADRSLGIRAAGLAKENRSIGETKSYFLPKLFQD